MKSGRHYSEDEILDEWTSKLTDIINKQPSDFALKYMIKKVGELFDNVVKEEMK